MKKKVSFVNEIRDNTIDDSSSDTGKRSIYAYNKHYIETT